MIVDPPPPGPEIVWQVTKANRQRFECEMRTGCLIRSGDFYVKVSTKPVWRFHQACWEDAHPDLEMPYALPYKR